LFVVGGLNTSLDGMREWAIDMLCAIGEADEDAAAHELAGMLRRGKKIKILQRGRDYTIERNHTLKELYCNLGISLKVIE
jgi:hypothetical protein